MKKNLMWLCVFSALTFLSCEHGGENMALEMPKSPVDSNIIFGSVDELTAFTNADQTIDYNLVKKLVVAEVVSNKMHYTRSWNNCHLSSLPIPVYGLDNIPLYYDFLIIDDTNTPVGVITAYARKNSDKIIARIENNVNKYNVATRTSSNYRLYSDKNGTQYIGYNNTRSVNGSVLKNIKTGEDFIPNNRYDSDEEILKFMQDSVLPQLFLDPQILKFEQNAMKNRMEEAQNNSEKFWSEIEKVDLNIDNLNSSFDKIEVSRGLSDVLAIKSQETRGEYPYIHRYQEARWYTPSGSNYCGQWICGLILYANNCGNYRPDDIGTGPMVVENISHAIEIRSNNRLSASNVGRSDWDCYWHIREGQQAALRLFVNWQGIETQWHWTLMYGACRTVRVFSTSYYFLQLDNGSLVGFDYRYSRDPLDENNYWELQWFDTRFYVND